MNKYQIFDIIGDGTYGTVYRGVNKETNEKVAIKKLKDKIKSWNECLEQNEVKILKNLNHENIIKLTEIIREQSSEVYLIFEYCDINLYEYIKKYKSRKEQIPEYKIKNIIYQIINGLNYLHSKGFIHRDLKPENILYKENINQIKIGDFGVAKEILYNNNNLTDYVCTRWYRSPECVLKSKKYNFSIDVWAVGCIMFELYNLNPCFPGNDEFDQLNKICNILGTPNFNEWPEGFKLIQKLNMKFPICSKKNLKNIIYGISSDGIQVLNDIFQFDYKKRPSCNELLKYNYFKNISYRTFSSRNDINHFYNNYNSFHSNNNLSYNHSKIDSLNNANAYNQIELIDHEKNNYNYINNYRDYRNNGNIISDVKSKFNNNIDNFSYNNDNNNNNNYYNNYSKYSSFIKNNIFSENKKKLQNIHFKEHNNSYINNNNNIYSKYNSNYNYLYNKSLSGRMYNYGSFLYN